MTTNKVLPVVLSGGSGTRLWPLSRSGFPKQFLILSGSNSLFQQAVERVNDIAASDIEVGETIVVTNEEYRFLALDHLRELGTASASVLLEPVAKNTAPALTLAALRAIELGDDPVLVVTPADQTIVNCEAFKTAVQNGVRAAAAGDLVILGITPDKPETGYGYIKHGGEVGQYGEYAVTQFAEKPSAALAQSYVESGEYVWNSGMFILKASTWLKALEHFCPDMGNPLREAWKNKKVDDMFTRPNKAEFLHVPSLSVDYAVMEKCPNSIFRIQMIPLDAGWSDLGAWDALWELGEHDGDGNVSYGDTIIVDTTNTLVHATSRLVGTIGVSDLVVVETADAVLVADRKQSQNVKKIVTLLQKQKRAEHMLHRKVHRPWGWYDSIDEAERFKVKRIMVNPKASLSLQMHHHRAEHWIVVKGTAEVTCGTKTILLTENQSTYIPLGEMHRLTNPGSIPLEIIEVQSGSYLGEDDIVRYDDQYGREQ